MDRRTTSITSCANDTKWRELQQRMAAHLTDAPYWRTKYLPALAGGSWQLAHEPTPATTSEPRSPDCCDDTWDGEWYYHFRSDNEYPRIEWCDMKPKPHPGAMPLGTIAAICEATGFEYEVHPEFVRAFGYRRTTR